MRKHQKIVSKDDLFSDMKGSKIETIIIVCKMTSKRKRKVFKMFKRTLIFGLPSDVRKFNPV